jgi:RNA polymerase sigma factor (sigma-70 family)
MSKIKKNKKSGEPIGSLVSSVMPGQDPLERLLDSESDEDFGDAVILEHLDENSQPLILRDWTAKDFANIYVRFYPHVLRQAKRYLTNHSQAEEVTQDAFLYLMTSLPEVDSEVGVLKLLKWKTRLLALDVIKANSGAKFAPLDDQLELSVDDSEMTLEIERADDAAIVSLALAKLEPRQREALIASLYEEKATSEVAGQLGLNENATRQLVFRAKSAFKKALVGEAETRGLSVSEILSVAARKASKDAGKYASAASALLLVIAVSIAVLPNLGNSDQQLVAGGPAATESSTESSTESGAAVAPASEEPQDAVVDATVDAGSLVAAENTVQDVVTVALAADLDPVPNSVPADSEPATEALASTQPASLGATVDLSPFDPWLLDPLVQGGSIQTRLLNVSASASPNASSLLSIVSDEGVWADVTFQPANATPFQQVRLGIQVDGGQYFASVSSADLLVLARDSTSETYVFIGSIGALTDLNGNLYRQTRLDGGRLQISLTVNSQTGEVSNTSLSLTDRA